MDKKYKSFFEKRLKRFNINSRFLGAILLTVRYHGIAGRAQRRRAEHQ